MVMHLTVLMRAGAPAYDVAGELVEHLDFQLRRDVDRRLRVWRTDPDGEGRTLLTVADHRSKDRLRGGYDIALSVDVDDELLGWELFDDLRVLRRPALLCQDTRVLLAWSPERGARVAETDYDIWDDYLLEPVTTPVEIAADDVLGGLYRRILADPDDDGLRLSYADAVAADHPDYAELIRGQVARTRDSRAAIVWEADRAVELYRLVDRYRDDILPVDARDLIDDRFEIGGGFVESVTMEADVFIDVAERLLAVCPIRMVSLKSVSARVLPTLVALPQLERLRGLSLAWNQIGDEGLRTLLTSPHLTGLRWLDLTRTGVTPAGIELLAASGAVPQLRYVRADQQLALNPEPGFEWTGALVYVGKADLAERLGEQHDAAWLHRGYQDMWGDALGPTYREV
jgi:uncharacterized protein (TIGR02996 family)